MLHADTVYEQEHLLCGAITVGGRYLGLQLVIWDGPALAMMAAGCSRPVMARTETGIW